MPSLPTKPALRERYDRRQEEVVDAAAELFGANGFQATSMADLSSATGLTVGGLYHYVGSKDELLFRICHGLMEPLLDHARAIAADGSLTPGERLRALLGEWVGHVIARRHSMLVFGQERHVIEREPRWREIRRARKEFERVLDDLLEQGRASGELSYDDRAVTLLALLGMVNHVPQWYRPRGPLGPDEIADGYWRLLARAGS
ncbi:MAG: TetR/AcrR family transcriptional regulator [Solirubrobacterales bacterium]|nr:TetR/AcrR family transcriptional regulator [Solirubrobacterales bacterium]